jgi:ABC-type branched-subunit amino acid transport system substrate-binding protein
VLVAALAAAGIAGARTAKKPGPIKVMAMEAFTIPASGLVDPHFQAAVARADAINAAGGIDGRRITVLRCDTKSDPNQAAACARKAVAEKVVAVIGADTINATPAFPILAKAGIAEIGGIAPDPVQGTLKNSFPFSGTVTQYVGAPKAIALAGGKKMGVILPQFPGVDQVVGALKQIAPSVGIQVGNVQILPFDTSDFAPAAAAALSGGADSAFVFFPGPNQATALRAVRQFDPSAILATLNIYVTPDVVKALGPVADNLNLVAAALPASDTSSPGIRMMNADFAKYARNMPKVDGATVLWASMYALEQVLRHVKTISAASVTAAMNHETKLSTGGIIPPYNATKRGPVPGFPRVFNPTSVIARLVDGQARVVDKANPFYNPFG